MGKTVILAALAATMSLMALPAHAGVSWSLGISAPVGYGSVGTVISGGPVYAAPPVLAPAPVIVAPAPVVLAPVPVAVAPPVVFVGGNYVAYRGPLHRAWYPYRHWHH
jgi:hypothetical protein